MTRAPITAAGSACPTDLCLFSECHCAPSERQRTAGWPLRLLGTVAVGLALAGVVLPLLPTTPFLLLATWAFARSSPRLDAWLRGHPRLGPTLAAWESRRAIPRRAKALAGVSLPAGWLLLWFGGVSPAIAVAAGLVILTVGLWIFTRPSPAAPSGPKPRIGRVGAADARMSLASDGSEDPT